MKSHFAPFLMSCAAALAAGACSPQASAPDAATEREPAPTEGAAETELLVYDETADGIPVSARYPETMQVAASGSGEGVGIFFTFVPQGSAMDDAMVHVFLPAGAASAQEHETFVTGPSGLMANNGWTEGVVADGGSGRFAYGWVGKVINFSTDTEQSGHILLGEAMGQAVRVTLLYPAEMADAYWPAAAAVLDSLEFDRDLLPIRSSGRL
jgi:hypothetical protein